MKIVTKPIGMIMLCLYSVIFMSCSNNKEVRQIKMLIGRKISFDIPLNQINEDTILKFSPSYFSQNPKIITYYDETSCTKCMISSNIIMKRYLDSLYIPAELIVIAYPVNDSLLSSYMKDLRASFILLSDVDNMFLRKNKMEKILARNRTMLLDKNNKIVLVGEPFHNSKLAKLYRDAASKLILQ